MRQLCKGNVAVVKAAILAGCRAYYGYPITPASEIAEAAALYFPQVGGTFIQAESGVAALLDHGGQGLLLLWRSERGALFNRLVLERVLDEAQGLGAIRVVRLQGSVDLLADLCFECACVGHGSLSELQI